MKYTKEGKVTFCLDYEERPNAQIMLVISVSDTGIGIKQEDLGKLFESFTRIEEKRNRNIEGTGLGLNLTKNLVDLMGGEISVDSTYGQGSCFTAKIPQKIVDAKPMGDFGKRYQQYLNTSDENTLSFFAPEAKILVVDDVEMNLRVVQGLLKETRIQIDTAGSGRECLECVKRSQYDMIFLDHMMPEMDGIETLRNMKTLADNLNREIPVIMLTANAIIGAKEEYIEAGFTDYLTKPIRETELLEMLLNYLPEKLVCKKDEQEIEESENKERQNLKDPGLPETEARTDESGISQIQLLKKLEGLDVKIGLTYCMNEEDFYVEMLQEYIKADKLSDMKQFFAAEDWRNYKTTVHALKSTSLTIGAAHLSERAKALELAAKDGDVGYIRSHHNDTLEEYVGLIDKLKEIL